MGILHSPKLQDYWNLTFRLFCVISRTLVGWGVPICRKTVCVFYSPSRLGKPYGLPPTAKRWLPKRWSYPSAEVQFADRTTKWLNNSVWSIDGTLAGITALVSVDVNNGNKEVLHISLKSYHTLDTRWGCSRRIQIPLLRGLTQLHDLKLLFLSNNHSLYSYI